MAQIPEIDMSLIEALTELDIWLKGKGTLLELKIIGATALHLHHIEIHRQSIDIDIANHITDKDIQQKIGEIGNGHGLGDTWLETPGVNLPENVEFTEHRLFKPLKNIDAKIVDLNTLLGLKIAAYYDRKEIQTTDIEDAQAIIDSGVKLTPEILGFAISEIEKSPKYDEDKLKLILKEVKQLAPKT